MLNSWQPTHTVYGGADRFQAGLAAKLNSIALKALADLRANPKAGAIWAAETFQAVENRAKTSSAGLVEDIRIDFEDGYGTRSDEEEDGHAQKAGQMLLEASRNGQLPPRIGLRTKPFHQGLAQRALRTLELFCKQLSGLDRPLRLTLPKVGDHLQVELALHITQALAQEHGLTFELELMIEDPVALGRMARLLAPKHSEGSRGTSIRAIHFGPYDFLASCGISQGDLHHPLCQRAKQDILFSALRHPYPLEVSDGPTSLLPIAPHRQENLSEAQLAENQQALIKAYQLHYFNVTQSREQGYRQSWVLHPAQLVSLHLSTAESLGQGLQEACGRLEHYLQARQSGGATRVLQQFDDLATIRVACNQVSQALHYGLGNLERQRTLLDEISAI